MMSWLRYKVVLFFLIIMLNINPWNWRSKASRSEMKKRRRLIRNTQLIKYHATDCFFTRYPRKLHKIRDKVKRGEKIRVGFFVMDASKWSCHSVYRCFTESSLFEPVICVFPHLDVGVAPKMSYSAHNIHTVNLPDEGDYEELIAFYEKLGCKIRRGYDVQDHAYKIAPQFSDLDIIFMEQPWPIVPPELSVEALSHSALICYIPYGFITAAGIESFQYNLPLHNMAWRVFAETKWHVEQFRRYGIMDAKNVVALGYPKLDVLKEPPSRPADSIWKSRLSSHIHRIIWAPHWTVGDHEILRFSTFTQMSKLFLDFARHDPTFDWLFKPHPNLYKSLVLHGFMSQQEVDDYYNAWSQLPNGQICLDGAFWDYFKTSDALITDSVSFLVEYLPTQKPILRVISDNCSGLNPLVEEMAKTYYNARNFTDVQAFLDTVIVAQHDEKKAQRIQALQVLPNVGTSGMEIVRYIEKQIRTDTDDS